MSKCSKCGAENPDSAKFCIKCGRDLSLVFVQFVDNQYTIGSVNAKCAIQNGMTNGT